MKAKLAIAFLITLAIPISHVEAQTTEEVPLVVKPKLMYVNMFISGALVGNKSAGVAFSFNMIHGIRRGRFAGGIGIGYDGYDNSKVVPLTASVFYDVVKVKTNAFFLQMTGGVALDAWRDTDAYIGGPSYNFTGGTTFGSMIGYRINAGKFNMYVSAGYKYQQINYDYTYNMWWIDDMMPGNSYIPPSYSLKETMERFSVQIGFGLH